jgi:hypothetical protein
MYNMYVCMYVCVCVYVCMHVCIVVVATFVNCFDFEIIVSGVCGIVLNRKLHTLATDGYKNISPKANIYIQYTNNIDIRIE